MRIVSSFHDFYDTVQVTGQDQTLVYLRKRREENLTKETFPFPLLGNNEWFSGWVRQGVSALSIIHYVIGFCNKVYPLLRLSYQQQSHPHPDTGFCYSLADVDAFVEHYLKRREIETYRSKPRRWRIADIWWPEERRRDMFKEFFDIYLTNQSTYNHLFVDSRCPIFVASTWWGSSPNRQYKIVYNECLKELEFFRVMDTYTAYQELQMFFGNLAQPNKPIPEIADKDMVSIKGFDKWSFRKPPQ